MAKRFDGGEFMCEWGGWAKWSDARAMVEEAYERGYREGVEDGKRQAANAAGVKACSDPRAYTNAISEAAQSYLDQFPNAHPLPAQWRWSDLWDRMNAAALGVMASDGSQP